jgi:hypothetical protein
MIANQIAGLLTGGVAASLTDYESIATATVGSGGASFVEFTSIPSTYSHLQVRMMFTKSASGYFAGYFNSDSTPSNYDSHYIEGNGTTAGAGRVSDSVLGFFGSSSTIPIGSVWDILDYSSTNKYKTGRSLTGQDQGGGASIVFHSQLWKSTAAINSIKIIPASGTIAQYGSFALYGIK